MSKWQNVHLGDIIKTNQSTYSPKENWKFVNYLDTGNITANRVEKIQYINTDIDKLPSRAKRKVKRDSIIYSTVRPNQLHYGIIKNQPDNFLVSTGFVVIDVNTDKAIPEYIYYVLSQNEIIEHLQAIAEQSVSAYPSIKPSDIENLNILLPNIEIQKRIVSILSVIDGKITVNETINNNLLQQSLYIFETLINSASKDGCIGDYCTLKSGFAFKSKWWQDSGIPVIKIGSINQDYLNLSNCSHVSEDKISLAKDFIVSGGDLLIAMTGATIGKFTMVPKMHKTILVNQRVGKFFLGENPINKIPFIYCTLKQPEIISEIINRGQGSAQPNISASDIMSIPCVIPQTDEINNFNLQTAPMFELIINNQFENLILAKTRDLLLPRLMSGEIDISNISF